MFFDESFEQLQRKFFTRFLPKRAVVIIVCSLICVVLVALYCLVSSTNSSFTLTHADEASIGVSLDEPSAGVDTSGESVVAQEALIYIHITGAVVTPGLYGLPEKSRVNDAVVLAGGFAEGADQTALNLARIISDGEQIVVPFIGESQTNTESSGTQTTVNTTSSSKVNINTASATELDVLPGVGPSLAQKIIADREQNGVFKTVDDLTRVSGIGDKKLETMRDYITVG